MGVESTADAAFFTREDWPERARVRGLAPVGLGTGWVEAASGLLVATAALNRLGVRPFLERVLARVAAEAGQPGESADELAAFARDLLKSPEAAVNGSGMTARTWVRILSDATLQPDLERTTLIPWSGVFAARGTLRDERAFCPACLWDWAREETPVPATRVWEPLRWQLQALALCVVHGVRLQVSCPNPRCGRRRGVIAGWASSEICVGCRLPFARRADEVRAVEPPISADEIDWARFVDTELSDILAHPPSGGVVDRASFAEILSVALESVAGGRQREFALRIGMTEASVSYWKSGQRAPTLEAILRVCRAAGFHLRHVLEGDLEALKASPAPEEPPFVSPSTETHVALDAIEMERVLRSALTADPPPTLASVYADPRVSVSRARRSFVVLCSQIRERHKAWRQVQERAQFDERAALIRLQVALLSSRDIYPSMNQVRKNLGGVFWLRRMEFRKIWRIAVMDAGWGDPSELVRVKGGGIPAPERTGLSTGQSPP